MRNPRGPTGAVLGLALLLALSVLSVGFAACSKAPEPAQAEATAPSPPPSGPGAMAPYLLAADNGGLWLSWLEPREEGHKLAVARYREGAWSEATAITQGDDFFANWADTPVLAQHPNGTLLAAWLARLGEGTYAYGVQLAVSGANGSEWRRLGSLHPDDTSPTEHGFMSFAPEGEGFRAFWLDGRDHAEHGMQLRTAPVDLETGAGPSEILDDLVCDCCPTAAATVDGEVLVAYRDRTSGEIRDILVSNLAGASTELGAESWNIAGCPVNGPALASAGNYTFAAWFTAADGLPRVRAAWREMSSADWNPPVDIAGEGVLGRVALTVGERPGEAYLSWLQARDGKGQVTIQRLTPGQTLSTPWRAGAADSDRASGIPRIAVSGEHLYAVWTSESNLHFARRSFSEFEPR